MDIDYTGFIHVVAPDGSILAQEDRLMKSRGRTTSRWSVGPLARDQYRLELPPDIEGGDYVISVGVYHWKTGERLPMRDEQGRRVPGNAIAVRVLTIPPPT